MSTSSLTKITGITYLRIMARSRGWPYIASWAHRITGVMLVIYVLFHIMTLSTLRNPDAFESKMKFFASVFPLFLEWFLAVPVIYHALNGGRLILYELFENRQDQVLLKWVLGLSVSYLLLLGLFMFMGNQTVSALFFWTYMAAASGFITYVTVTRVRLSGASINWKLQRISAAFLFLMIPAHMLYMHLDPALGRDAQVIIARMQNSFIKLIDILLVVSVLYHGAYGLIEICRDYLISKRVLLCCTAGIIVVSTYFALIGVKLTVLI